MATLGTPTSQACPKCGTGWKKIGFSFIALFVVAGISSLVLWFQNTGSASKVKELETQVQGLELDLGLKNVEIDNLPGPTPLFYNAVDEATGYSSGILMYDPELNESKEIITGNRVVFAVPKLDYDGKIFTVMGPVDGDLPSREVNVFDVATEISKTTGISVASNATDNTVSPSERYLVTGVEFLDNVLKVDYKENQILLFDLVTEKVSVLGTYRDGEDLDAAAPNARFANLRDIQVHWLSPTCANVRIYAVSNEPDTSEGAEPGATVQVRRHKEWREFWIE